MVTTTPLIRCSSKSKSTSCIFLPRVAVSPLAGESHCCKWSSSRNFVDFAETSGKSWPRLAETSLNVPFENVEALDSVLDGYIVDIKDMNPDIYKAYTGQDNALVLSNLQWILQHGDPKRIMVRVPHIPEFNTDEDVKRSKDQLAAMGVKNIDEFQYIIR